MSWDLLFDTPWWMPLGLAVAGIAIWLSGNNRRDKALMGIGSVAVLAAVALTAISYIVHTPRELAERATRALVAAVVQHDLDSAREVLDPGAHVSVMGGRMQYSNREQILAAVDRAHTLFGLESVSISNLRSQRQGPLIIVDLDAISVQTATGGRPLPTTWQFEFQEGPDGWKLWRITLVRVSNFSPNDIARQLPVLPQ